MLGKYAILEVDSVSLRIETNQLIIDFALIVSFTFHGDVTSLCLNGGLYMKDSSNLNDLWNRLFPLQVGTKVKVVRIFFKKRLQVFGPQLQEFIGEKGEIVGVETSFLDEDGWYTRKDDHPNAKQIFCYQVYFPKINNQWAFMREDLEVIK